MEDEDEEGGGGATYSTAARAGCVSLTRVILDTVSTTDGTSHNCI